MKRTKLEENIEKEKLKKERFLSEKDELEKKIKECDEKISKYTLMLNNDKFNDFQKALNMKGVSFETVLEALQKGDFMELQEYLEVSQNDADEKNDGQN